jgi:hypothetical protein
VAIGKTRGSSPSPAHATSSATVISSSAAETSKASKRFPEHEEGSVWKEIGGRWNRRREERPGTSHGSGARGASGVASVIVCSIDRFFITPTSW